METRTQNGGVGGSMSGGLLRALRDGGGGGGSRPQAGDSSEPPLREPPVLSLDQIRSLRTSNEYTEGPTVAAPKPPTAAASQGKPGEVAPWVGGPVTQSESTLEPQQMQQERIPQRASLYPQPPMHLAPPRDAPSRSVSVESSQAPSVRTSTGSSSSEQRLLGGSPVTPNRVVRAQPLKRSEIKSEDLKPLALANVAAGGQSEGLGKHAHLCEDCGRCRCKECTCPRRLPSCWLCGQRCLCSAENAVDYGTCVCCVKGLFYHCSTDDEDTCADKPFSCSQAHCCARWSTLGALALLLPCLLCYLPAKGCLSLCQLCHDRATRPGCRCKNTDVVHCKNLDKPT
ncbi:hypothetical protein ACEWY4_016809 [Coilia grayii]|uniref:Protein sprouty homolog 2 n=1 Tax=Coilia grayii TaxID=363190 RepID=A0ABD1JP67_9TELE